jgi:hypothetical protein
MRLEDKAPSPRVWNRIPDRSGEDRRPGLEGAGAVAA